MACMVRATGLPNLILSSPYSFYLWVNVTLPVSDQSKLLNHKSCVIIVIQVHKDDRVPLRGASKSNHYLFDPGTTEESRGPIELNAIKLSSFPRQHIRCRIAFNNSSWTFSSIFQCHRTGFVDTITIQDDVKFCICVAQKSSSRRTNPELCLIFIIIETIIDLNFGNCSTSTSMSAKTTLQSNSLCRRIPEPQTANQPNKVDSGRTILLS
jgi:hypothetical protein